MRRTIVLDSFQTKPRQLEKKKTETKYNDGTCDHAIESTTHKLFASKNTSTKKSFKLHPSHILHFGITKNRKNLVRARTPRHAAPCGEFRQHFSRRSFRQLAVNSLIPGLRLRPLAPRRMQGSEQFAKTNKNKYFNFYFIFIIAFDQKCITTFANN